jgi:fatty-acyl-CoA synthase
VQLLGDGYLTTATQAARISEEALLGKLNADADWAWLATDAVAWQAKIRPNKTAINEIATAHSLSFAELDLEIRKVAGQLEQSFSPGARVATLARNSVWQIALFFACERTGRVYVPINWRLSGAEIAALLADCQPEAFIVDEEFAAEADAALAAIAVRDVHRPDAWMALYAAATPSASGVIDPGACCVILYTSGSTGRSKGVIVTPKTAQASAQNYLFVAELTADSVMLCETPLFHVVALLAGVRGSLLAGATLLLNDRFVAADTLARLADPREGITHSFCVPQMAIALRREPGWDRADFSHLTALFSGGAPLPPQIALDFLDKGVVIANGFGMTENGTLIGMPLDPEVVARKTAAAGIPAPAAEIRLVSAEGVDVGPGDVGEIWVRGPTVMPGYWKQPETTAKAFHDGWFKTGDAARRDEDGFYYIVDRWKDMYITGGENVYPAEVEAALLEVLPLDDVAVVGVPDTQWGETGVAYIVVGGGQLAADDILAACRGRLARYKHPKHVRFIDEIPRTASGKVKKDVLRASFAAESATQAST